MAARMQKLVGAKALHVMAVPANGGWLYFAEVVDQQEEGEVHTRAVGHAAFPSAASALANGMAYARWIASDNAGCYDPDADLEVEVRPN